MVISLTEQLKSASECSEARKETFHLDFIIVTDLDYKCRSLVTPRNRSGKQVMSIVLYHGQMFFVHSSQKGAEELHSFSESLLRFLIQYRV